VKHARSTLVVITFLSTAALFAACASGNDSENSSGLGFGGEGGESPTTVGPGATTGPGNTTGNGGAGGSPSMGCAAHCSADTECQSTCGQPTDGTYCCDTANGMCYLSSQSECGGGSSTTTSSSGGY
jgi:hypothetical protein